MNRILVTLGLCALPLAPLFAINKPALETHLRKALNLDPRMAITIEDPIKPDVGNMFVVPVTLAGAKYTVFLTKDEKKYIWGQVMDMTVDPDATRANAISLKDAYFLGSSTAPVTLVEYSDMQCPHCSKAHEDLTSTLYKSYSPGQVRWVYKHFPLQGHDWAEPAAAASECVAAQKPDAFFEVTHLFYKNASNITADSVKDKAAQFAMELKVSSGAVRACMDDPKIIEKIRANKAEGQAVGVSSTPTLFVNGRMKRGYRDFEELKALIDEKLAEAQKKK